MHAHGYRKVYIILWTTPSSLELSHNKVLSICSRDSKEIPFYNSLSCPILKNISNYSTTITYKEGTKMKTLWSTWSGQFYYIFPCLKIIDHDNNKKGIHKICEEWLKPKTLRMLILKWNSTISYELVKIILMIMEYITKNLSHCIPSPMVMALSKM